MAITLKTSRIQQQTADQKLMDGLTQSQQTLPSFMIGSASIKTTDVIAILQERIKNANTVESTRAAWQTAVKGNRDERVKTQLLVSGVRQSLQMMFAGSIDTLAEYGLAPRKQRTPLTPEEKAAAVAKARATREARHTMGSRQKAKIKGEVSPTSPATPPSAAAPVATPSPAPGTPVAVAAPRNS
jgi:hypothetical protein